ncbi:uncharacterized protein METZ01_LOCUS384495 [marine metagenome]|uniref:Uncharacterized protein n=1 Tax=marine metagenome TaxID=408172 RepID=A0A382UD18_9ZZZZ
MSKISVDEELIGNQNQLSPQDRQC